MTHLLDEPVSDPLPLYRHRDGIVAVDLLAVAVAHLDFFTWLADNPATPAAVCQQFDIHARPTDVMLTLFAAQGLITRSGGVWLVTLRAREHLTAGSRFNLAPYFASMKERPPTLDMLKVLRTGKPANWGSYDPQQWAEAMTRPDFAAHFTAAMDCRGRLTNAFSKKVENHSAAISLYFMFYNFGRVHQTLRVTPAMAAGVSDHVWNIDEIVALLD